MEDLNSVNRKPHKLLLTNRRTCNISGVNDVLSLMSMRSCLRQSREC